VSSHRLEVRFDEQKIDALFAAVDQCTLPGVAVGVAVDGVPVYRKGFGRAHMELPLLLSPSIRMRIGSTSKHFTALACMLLCEEGKASIDDPIRKFLPELHAVTGGVTMRQLMGNISGLRDACEIKLHFSGIGTAPVSSADFVRFYSSIDDMNAPPGAAWIYNNGGWVLLSAAIERIADASFEEVLRSRIFDRIGMRDTLVRRWDTDFVPNSAERHTINRASRFERLYYGHDFAGAGAIVSTVDDMLLWMKHMDAPTVGKPATWAAMKTSQHLLNGTRTGYGLGLFMNRYRGVDTIYHAGGGLGSNAHMLKVPAAALDVVVLANRDDVFAVPLAEKVLDASLPMLQESEGASDRPCVAGVFRSPSTGRVVQLATSSIYSWNEGAAQVVSIDGVEMSMKPDAAGVLWPTGVFGFYKQAVEIIGDPTRPAAIRLNDFGNVDELLPAPPAGDTESATITGEYQSAATGTRAMISNSEDGLRLRTHGRFGAADFRLECLAAGIWRAQALGARPYVGILAFNDSCTAFGYSSVYTRSLPFRRV
jgi:D-aminopeptidase